jgi:hypothetical protein
MMRATPFHASIASLALRMTTVFATIAMLQMMVILQERRECPGCLSELGPYKNNVNYNYFECRPCVTHMDLCTNK